MKETAHTKQAIIDAAQDLFHLRGVHATGIEEILQATGTGKSQFYHYFKNKDDLVHEVMQRIIDGVKAGGPGGVFVIRSWRDLEAWFRFFIEFQRSTGCRRSCPIGTIGSELSGDQTQLRDDACEFYDCVRSMLAEFFSSRKRKGQLARSCDPCSLADFCVSIVQGGLLMAKIQRRAEPFENAVRHALKHIQTLRRP